MMSIDEKRVVQEVLDALGFNAVYNAEHLEYELFINYTNNRVYDYMLHVACFRDFEDFKMTMLKNSSFVEFDTNALCAHHIPNPFSKCKSWEEILVVADLVDHPPNAKL